MGSTNVPTTYKDITHFSAFMETSICLISHSTHFFLNALKKSAEHNSQLALGSCLTGTIRPELRLLHG